MVSVHYKTCRQCGQCTRVYWCKYNLCIIKVVILLLFVISIKYFILYTSGNNLVICITEC